MGEVINIFRKKESDKSENTAKKEDNINIFEKNIEENKKKKAALEDRRKEDNLVVKKRYKLKK